MPDPTPNEGFTVNINEAEMAATQSLPTAVALLREPVATLVSLVDFEGANVYSASDRAMKRSGSTRTVSAAGRRTLPGSSRRPPKR